MEQEIRGRFVNGKVELLEEADLFEGEEVKVVISSDVKRKGTAKSFLETSGGWRDDVEYWGEFLREWYVKRGRIDS